MSATNGKRRHGGNGKSKRKARPASGPARFGRASRRNPNDRPVLITGGAGFIGTNLAHRFLSAGQPVLVFDNLSRPGVERNLQWLRETHSDLLRVQVGQVQDVRALAEAV